MYLNQPVHTFFQQNWLVRLSCTQTHLFVWQPKNSGEQPNHTHTLSESHFSLNDREIKLFGSTLLSVVVVKCWKILCHILLAHALHFEKRRQRLLLLWLYNHCQSTTIITTAGTHTQTHTKLLPFKGQNQSAKPRRLVVTRYPGGFDRLMVEPSKSSRHTLWPIWQQKQTPKCATHF